MDVGGTWTKICVSDEDLNILETKKIPTDKSVNIIGFLERSIHEQLRLVPEISCVSLGLPGTVDVKTGNVHTAPSIIVGERNIRKELSERISLPIIIENDVSCWAIAEGKIGACRGIGDYLFVTIGTGIGACIVSGGNIYRGAHLAAGEIGYMVFLEDLSHPARGRDEFGSFESKASAGAILRDYRILTQEDVSSSEMFRRFKGMEDDAAKAYISKKMDYLAVSLANAIVLLDPEVVVLAGGITGEWPYLSAELNQRLQKLICSKTRIQVSQTGEYGGSLGAIIHARETLQI